MLNNLSLFLSTCFLFHSTLAQDRPEKIPVRLSGFLLDDDGNAISGGKLQIWQTDTLGTYDHPRSMNIEDGLDPDFQYYGTATSGEDGSYSFLTIRPEHYPARPESHIHFKIFVDDALVLTTQMYFRDENHPYPDSLQLDLSPHEEGGFSTEKNISVELGGGGNNPVTPSQASGPYYPVVDFFDVGNNLILIESEFISPTLGPSSSPSSIISGSEPQPTWNIILLRLIDIISNLFFLFLSPVKGLLFQ